MSALGQKQTFAVQKGMSALKANIELVDGFLFRQLSDTLST